MSFDGSAKTEKYGGYGSCSWILWQLPEWTIVTAASAFLESTTVNVAEYSGMNNGVTAALDHGVEELVIVGDSRLAIQQSLGVIACKKDSLMAKLNHHRERTARLNSGIHPFFSKKPAASRKVLRNPLRGAQAAPVTFWCCMEELSQDRVVEHRGWTLRLRHSSGSCLPPFPTPWRAVEMVPWSTLHPAARYPVSSSS
ncbi:hypothetical protein PHMEG_00035677 [Phytophthora megakarya]|uniref:RNase H type-1 domain-containing protein n=1 Tax=Phytophthora megakarya TaxID=4795 RepID=A0A225UMU7_9STRA|nr:hypothetical protein PHMEG_00035677 [Phytophthora megakarya]